MSIERKIDWFFGLLLFNLETVVDLAILQNNVRYVLARRNLLWEVLFSIYLIHVKPTLRTRYFRIALLNKAGIAGRLMVTLELRKQVFGWELPPDLANLYQFVLIIWILLVCPLAIARSTILCNFERASRNTFVSDSALFFSYGAA